MDEDSNSFTQPTQPTQPTQATQQPPRNESRDDPAVFANLVPRHPHLLPVSLETEKLLDGGYTIGRLEKYDIVVDRNFVSGCHCRIYMEQDSPNNLYIADTSTHGTYINDRVLGRGSCTVLLHNDRIGFINPIDALPSDVSLEYSIEIVGYANRMNNSGQSDFPIELQRSYDFKHEIGVGNFAKVWLAIHKPTGISCACKAINKKRHLFNSGLTKVFEREISIMKQLKHPHIVSLNELHVNKSHIYIFMEYVEGGDLFTYLSDHGSFTETGSRPLFFQACNAVRYLHENGITHRDIKLDNILLKLSPSGTIDSVKLADFGLARAVGDGDLMKTICGTPSYLAPEIVCRTSTSTAYSKSVDIWALGVVLYALHLNSFPFSKMFLNGSESAIGSGGLSLDAYRKASKLTEANTKYICLSESLRDLLMQMLLVDSSKRIDIESTILHPWTQTSQDGVPGLLYEPFDVWGRLFYGDENSVVDLFRPRTLMGRSRKSHIQLPDPAISSQQCEIIFKDQKVYIRNIGRGTCLLGGQPMATSRNTMAAIKDHSNSFSLSTQREAEGYKFRVQILDKPWKRVWAAAASSDNNTTTEYPEPLLILPVQSDHLSQLPFKHSRHAYAMGGKLQLESKKLENCPPCWATLSVLDNSYPRLHLCDTKVTFGRGPDCTVRFDEPQISHIHCTIEKGDQTLLRNHSSNGTFVNCKLVEKGSYLALKEGDEVVLLFDHINEQHNRKTLLGQHQILDSHGNPVLVGYQIIKIMR